MNIPRIPGVENFDLPFNIPGQLEKMKIHGYYDSTMAKEIPGSPFVVLFNPESYIRRYQMNYAKDQATGTDAAHLKYNSTAPVQVSFKFLFDKSLITPGNLSSDISDDLELFRKVVYDYLDPEHKCPFVKLAWGTLENLFKGQLTSLNVEYKLFSPDGKPLRAIADASFKGSIDDTEREKRHKKNSPDLTHIRIAKAGDTLPLMCKKIYDDPKYYLQVARFNNLNTFRSLIPGTEIFFPPIEKQSPENPS